MKKIFDPNKLFYKSEITGKDAEDFSFDLEILRKCLNTLAAKHGSCAIYGDRGVGKSSLALQVLSILNDQNAKFDKEELLHTGQEKDYKCVYFTCNSQITNFYDLLLAILRPAANKYSLSKVVPDIYSPNYQTHFSAKFKFDLYGLNFEIGVDKDKQKSPKVNEQATFAALSSKQVIINLFNDVIDEVAALDDNKQLIFFVDEINLLKNKDGLGEFLKISKNCRFVFIGVFEDILDILTDNISSGRDLIGGDIKVEPLSNDRINWIFKNAEQNSNDGVKFTDDFIRSAIKYSNGFPWIIQNLGFHAVDKRILKGHNKNETMVIGSDDFAPALNEVISIYRKEHENNIDFLRKRSFVEMKILNYLWDSPKPLEAIEIISYLENNGQYATTAIKELIKSRVIIQTKDKKYKYLDPTVRILMRHILDHVEKTK